MEDCRRAPLGWRHARTPRRRPEWDAAAHPRTPTPLPPDAVCDALALPTLVGVAATGEVVWVPASCAAYEWGPGRGVTHGWEPTGAARTLLEGLV